MNLVSLAVRLAAVFASCSVCFCLSAFAQSSGTSQTTKGYEYLWYEAENMRGFSVNERGEPILNPSYQSLSAAKAPGWGINGPGVSAEWSQGGESEWNSAAASPDERKASLFQDLEVPAAGDYKLWVRYADWAGKSENFSVTIVQNNQEVFRHEFGAADVIDPHDETSLYWQWAFAWDAAGTKLQKGPARVYFQIEKPAEARRHIDCFLLTNNPVYRPQGRMKPPFAADRLMAGWPDSISAQNSLLPPLNQGTVPALWQMRPIAGRGFVMPWNIAKEFWPMYEKPENERPISPFNSELIDDYVKAFSGKRDVPIFSSKLVTPVVYINDLGNLLKEGSPFLKYLRDTKSPFAVLINYGSANFSETDGPAAFKLLTGELKDQFLGWISGESIGNVWPPNQVNRLEISPSMTRREMLDAYRKFYTSAIDRKWTAMFKTPTGPMWDKMIVAQSTSSTSFAHALGEWGSRIIGIETSAVQPGYAMRIAFTRGAARQYGGSFLYYHAPNFGDTALTFTKTQNFGGPDFFLHSRYGPSMGPSLSWYRKSYYLYYMAGASAIYLEQGYDQFFKPGPGENPFQLNPLGRITNEFVRFAEKHPERGTPYTPIAFLLNPGHGFEMTDYPHWPFGVSQINREDRAIRELMGAAYYPLQVNEGEPATADRQVFIPSRFGDIFDVLVTSDTRGDAIDAYRALVVGGSIEWSPSWARRIEDYLRKGGVVLLNAAQINGLSSDVTGVSLNGQSGEADSAQCQMAGEAGVNLSGQRFRYQKLSLNGNTEVLIKSPQGDPLVTSKRVGKGRLIFNAVPDMLGLDERITPFSAHLLAHLFANATPVRVRGDAEFLINRTEDGWVVTLLSYRGVYKQQQGLAQVNRDEITPVSISLDQGNIAEAHEWTTEQRLTPVEEAGHPTIKVEIPAGGVRIVQLLEKH